MAGFSELRRFAGALAAVSPRLAGLTVVLTLAVGLLEGISLLALVPLLELVGLDAQTGGVGRMLNLFRTSFAGVGLEPTLPAVLAAYVAIVAAQSVLQRQQTLVQTRLREAIVHAVRTRLYRAIAGTTWAYFSRARLSHFGQLLTGRVDRVTSAAHYLLDLFVSTVLVLVYAGLALRVSPLITLFVMALGAALVLGMRGRLARARAAGQSSVMASSQLYSATFDHLQAMKTARSYGAEQRHAERFAELSRRMGESSVRAIETVVVSRQWMTIGSAVVLALVVYVSQAVAHLTPAALFLLIFLFARLVPRVTSLYDKAQTLAADLPAFEQLMQAEAECLAAAEPLPASRRVVPLDRSIECRDVTVRYRGPAEPPALDGVSLRIAAHATTAIVGPSGAGKSTLADVLMALIAPTAGALLVDGQPITPDAHVSWRAQIGYVAQDTFLFHDSVRANLLWASPDATDVDVWEALEQAAAADFVRSLPQGLDTVVGERGVLLSGGERQRLSLARALLRKPRVLLLDEATSAVDSENERRILQAIDRLHTQVTIVIITHRLSTIRNADMIYVLDAGRVVESGTWDGLAHASGRFRDLCLAQGVDTVAATDLQV
jgi:ATP-binding cassette, subfamily C, bacterial